MDGGSKVFKLTYNNVQKYVVVTFTEKVQIIDILEEAVNAFNIPLDKYVLYICDEYGIEIQQPVFGIFMKECNLSFDKRFFVKVVQSSEKYKDVSTQTEHNLQEEEYFASPLKREGCLLGFLPKKRRIEENLLKSELSLYLQKNIEGKRILDFYKEKNTLNKKFRIKLVNLLVNHLIQIEGTYPSAESKILWAKATALLFPNLCENQDPDNFKFFYDSQSRGGFVRYHLRTVNRSLGNNARLEKDFSVDESSEGIDGDNYDEDITWLKRACPRNDKNLIFEKMKKTILVRKIAFEINDFPRFFDTEGLVEQDFCILYSRENISDEVWENFLKGLERVQEEDTITIYDEFTTDDEKYNREINAFLVLAKLTRKVGKGRKQSGSSKCYNYKLITFQKTGSYYQEEVLSHPPRLHVTGECKKHISTFEIIFYGKRIPLGEVSTKEALLLVFKSFYVFHIEYPPEK